MRDIDKIQRQVHFMYAQIFDEEDSSGKNNTWNYNRAPDGYKFRLEKINMAVDRVNSFGIVSMFDGHEYTHWNIYPGVQSNEMISYSQFSNAVGLDYADMLLGWECKEYTLGVRSTSTTNIFKVVIIVWYYLEKMSHLEKLYYAVIQPRWNRFKKAFRTTLDPKDE
ncbi:unnamed protein product [marine sediment metagenome]|uniref:Uncharacterized protein n=1 Tax=marine sediment metagenome TaxID=412755 RepID=X1T113_9ZZZZ